MRRTSTGATDDAFGAIWIGEVDLAEPLSSITLDRSGDRDHQWARLLVRLHRRPIGFVSMEVRDGFIDGNTLQERIWNDLSGAILSRLRADQLPDVSDLLRRISTVARVMGGPAGTEPEPRPDLVSVVVCSRDRTDTLRGCLRAIQELEHTNFEVIVIDNAPRSTGTADMFHEQFASDARFRHVVEPVPGLARARNRGVAEARGAVVAFTDDDVRVDRWWLQGIAEGFRRHGHTGCVTGLIPAAELQTPEQLYFDQRVTWSASCEPRVYDMGDHHPRSPLFPFAAGQFGAGANFAFDREYLIALGGFDEALGAGAPTRGGEDLDIFVRALLAGRALVYEPSAIVWHVHRSEADELVTQMRSYGLGLAAYLTKHLAHPRTGLRMFARMPFAVLHACSMLRRGQDPSVDVSTGAPVPGLVAAEVRGMLGGPLAYYRGRRLARHRVPGPSASWGGPSVRVPARVADVHGDSPPRASAGGGRTPALSGAGGGGGSTGRS